MKARALTEMVYIDEIDVDQEGIAEMILDENAIAQVPRESAKGKYTVKDEYVCTYLFIFFISTYETALETRSGS